MTVFGNEMHLNAWNDMTLCTVLLAVQKNAHAIVFHILMLPLKYIESYVMSLIIIYDETCGCSF